MQGAEEPLSATTTALYAILVVLLVLGAGLMSGLTLGLLSLDVMDLEVRLLPDSNTLARTAARCCRGSAGVCVKIGFSCMIAAAGSIPQTHSHDGVPQHSSSGTWSTDARHQPLLSIWELVHMVLLGYMMLWQLRVACLRALCPAHPC